MIAAQLPMCESLQDREVTRVGRLVCEQVAKLSAGATAASVRSRSA
jgi:hypothetical protein